MTTKILIAVAAIAVIGLIIGGVVVLQDKSTRSGSASGNKSTKTTDLTSSPVATALKSTDQVVGSGAEAKEGSKITVKYTGKLTDGTVFDSTEKQGGTPATFTLSKGSLIDGWVQGIPGMKVGGKRNLIIPAALGYGKQANGSIPANSTLEFDIELVDVQ